MKHACETQILLACENNPKYGYKQAKQYLKWGVNNYKKDLESITQIPINNHLLTKGKQIHIPYKTWF